jgi:hypothetical protein
MTRVLLNFLLGCHPVCSWAMSEFWILLSCTYSWFSLISPYSCKVPGPLLQDDISEEIMSDYSLVLYFFIYCVRVYVLSSKFSCSSVPLMHLFKYVNYQCSLSFFVHTSMQHFLNQDKVVVTCIEYMSHQYIHLWEVTFSSCVLQ